MHTRTPIWMLCVTLVAADDSSASSSPPSSTWDSVRTLRRAAFASCHSLTYAETGGAFAWLKAYDPEAFFWLGDAVYVQRTDTATLAEAYRNMTAFPDYAAFVAQTGAANIDGTWDDHDYGVNDSGKEMHDKATRQTLFLNFTANNTPARAYPQRQGVYSAHLLTSGVRKVGVFLLDTRSHRDPYYFRPWHSLPRAVLSWSGAVSRLMSGVLGLYSDGDVLGEGQWEWLDGVLAGSDLDAHIVVSSVQVSTANPVVESWGHFPVARQRLMQRFEGRNSVVFVSGDVHHAELGTMHEITTSGMTHSFATMRRGVRWLGAALLAFFSSHREQDALYTGMNYLALDIDWDAGMLHFAIRGDGPGAGTTVLSRDVPLGQPTHSLTKQRRVFVQTELHPTTLLCTAAAALFALCLLAKRAKR